MKNKTKYLFTTMGAIIALNVVPHTAYAEWKKPQIHEDINYWADMRYRYEGVEQDGIANDADASTFLFRAGVEYKPFEQLSFLAELETNTPLGGEEYNSTTNGKATYPVVADPDSTELNRLQATFTGIPDTTAVVGRQRVILDNSRYVGNVGWRQNEQTFDSVVLVNKSLPDTTLIGGYVWNVHRIFGSQSDMRKLDVDNTYLFNGKYTGFDFADITAYGYLLDVDENAALSSKTFGVRAKGAYPLNDDQKVLYTAEYAKQTDRADNTNDLSANYYLAELGFKHKAITVAAGFESLEGDGAATTAFQTPLATLHAHNGWADKFLTTPGDGLEDAYIKFLYKHDVPENDIIGDLKFTAVYHDFSAENNGTDYGQEINASVGTTFFGKFKTLLKYADYDEDGMFTDTEKLWFQVATKF